MFFGQNNLKTCFEMREILSMPKSLIIIVMDNHVNLTVEIIFL